MDLPLIYLICFGVGFVFAIVSAFGAEMFGGHDAHFQGHEIHAEGGPGGHSMPGFSAISPTTIAAFLTAFGGFGLIFSRIPATSAAWLSLLLSAVGGMIIAAVVVTIFNKIFRATQSSSEGRVAELFGQSATVITPIATGGVGEIAYIQGGTRYTAAARLDGADIAASGEKVRIVRVVGTQFYVTKD
jgi:membrane protein implicated in regulation of membrane protease activity